MNICRNQHLKENLFQTPRYGSTYIRTDDRLARAEGDRSCLLNSRPAVSAKKMTFFYYLLA